MQMAERQRVSFVIYWIGNNIDNTFHTWNYRLKHEIFITVTLK